MQFYFKSKATNVDFFVWSKRINIHNVQRYRKENYKIESKIRKKLINC